MPYHTNFSPEVRLTSTVPQAAYGEKNLAQALISSSYQLVKFVQPFTALFSFFKPSIKFHVVIGVKIIKDTKRGEFCEMRYCP